MALDWQISPISKPAVTKNSDPRETVGAPRLLTKQWLQLLSGATEPGKSPETEAGVSPGCPLGEDGTPAAPVFTLQRLARGWGNRAVRRYRQGTSLKHRGSEAEASRLELSLSVFLVTQAVTVLGGGGGGVFQSQN